MPTYEYRCPAGHTFEKIQKITEKPRAKCPTCGKMASRQISGGTGLVFKGSGFYITDYGKGSQGPRKPETGSEGSEAKSEKDTSAKPESPPAKAEKPAKKAKE